MLFQLLCTLLCVVTANCTRERLFCTSEQTVEITGQHENAAYLRGPNGRLGDIGEPGLPGMDGLVPAVDYETIYEKTDEKFNAAMDIARASFDERLSNLERLMASTEVTTAEQITTELTLSLEDLKVARLKGKGLCPVQHENICFWAEVRYHQDIYESTATSICQKDGGEVGNIYSREHYEDVMALIRSLIPARLKGDPARTWTALKVKPNGDVTLSDGVTRAPYLKWLASWYPEEGQTGVMLSVPVDPDAYYQGMTDIVPTRNAYGVLCQL